MEFVNCKKVCIDCCANDPVDIRAGGPDYLGFDFFVSEEELENMQAFILEAFSKLELPFISMKIDKEKYKLKLDEVWDRKRILKCLAMEAIFIKNEAKKDYGKGR